MCGTLFAFDVLTFETFKAIEKLLLKLRREHAKVVLFCHSVQVRVDVGRLYVYAFCFSWGHESLTTLVFCCAAA